MRKSSNETLEKRKKARVRKTSQGLYGSPEMTGQTKADKAYLASGVPEYQLVDPVRILGLTLTVLSQPRPPVLAFGVQSYQLVNLVRIPGWTEDREGTGNEVGDQDRGHRLVLDQKSGTRSKSKGLACPGGASKLKGRPEERPPEPRPGASPKDKHHPKAEVTSAGQGQGTGDLGGVCEEQEGLRKARISSRPSNRSRQVWVRWLNQTGARRASNEGQEAERSGKLASDKSREGVEDWDWLSPGLGAAPEPEVRGSSGGLTEVSPVVEASSGASPEGNSDLEVGSGVNPGWCARSNATQGVQSAEGHWLPLCFSRDLQVGLWSQMRGSPMGPNGQGHGVGALEQDLDMMQWLAQV
ncbi:hypothetical protein F5J12DRAFT_787560 [Pisolithus orientalis]|uniref:uncharacterized protein n=1 Tax=Pisolithus orientalis TaxID=936130 RepID=UPI0022245FD8|nr:uncharacterized protein F5J12DRAFT_787560 [Pisolithus orientalis]KAI5984550.1 hypothetical protein F5J12DRAFT_787560 [Pisolithus orientalis]